MIKEIIDSILSSKDKLYITCTGGGSLAISELLRSGGASKVFLGANIPYSHGAVSLLGGKAPEKACSKEMAEYLALSSGDIEEKDEGYIEHIGIGATCSLVKDNEREGREHNIYLAVASNDFYNGYKILDSVHIQLCEPRTRFEEEQLVARLILAYADCRMNLTKWHPLTHEPVLNWIGLTSKDKIESAK